MLKRHKRKAFTLVELIVVIVILAVLAAIAFMVLTKMIGKSRDSRRIADLSTMTKSLEMFLFSPDKAVTLVATWKASEFSSIAIWTALDEKTWRVAYQWPFSTDYWTKLRNLGFDALNKLPKDPQWMPYVIWIHALTLKDYSLGATLENQDSDTVGTMAIIDWNTFNKSISWSWTTSIKFPSLIFSGYYSDTTNYYYTSDVNDLNSQAILEASSLTVAQLTWSSISETNKTTIIPYKLTQ